MRRKSLRKNRNWKERRSKKKYLILRCPRRRFSLRCQVKSNLLNWNPTRCNRTSQLLRNLFKLSKISIIPKKQFRKNSKWKNRPHNQATLRPNLNNQRNPNKKANKNQTNKTQKKTPKQTCQS